MSQSVSIHEVAEIEIDEAADFYDIGSPGLGSVFIDEIERAVRSIAEFPEAAPLVRGRAFLATLLTSPTWRAITLHHSEREPDVASIRDRRSRHANDDSDGCSTESRTGTTCSQPEAAKPHVRGLAQPPLSLAERASLQAVGVSTGEPVVECQDAGEYKCLHLHQKKGVTHRTDVASQADRS